MLSKYWNVCTKLRKLEHFIILYFSHIVKISILLPKTCRIDFLILPYDHLVFNYVKKLPKFLFQ